MSKKIIVKKKTRVYARRIHKRQWQVYPSNAEEQNLGIIQINKDTNKIYFTGNKTRHGAKTLFIIICIMKQIERNNDIDIVKDFDNDLLDDFLSDTTMSRMNIQS